MKIERPDGITPSEKYLKRLCDRAFLPLWSYSGIFRDQKQGGKGDGKELCDLLVVFENHIIIFSDKYIEFPNSGNIQLDWSRWYRRAVKDSAEQIYGAERWIKKFPNRLFIDRKCTRPFPISLPDLEQANFHRIVVAHGLAEKCKEFFGGGSGSLIINNMIIGSEHEGDNCEPFSIGQVDIDRGYVHVFDEITLDVVLQTLDTITDFTNYLVKKERFLSAQIKVYIPGEEELLAYYFQKLNEFGEHDFVLPQDDLNFLLLEEGFWEDFITSPERLSQLEADRISYSWDALIETFNKNILEDTQHYAYPAGAINQEKIVKFLARENRTRRRMLMRSLYEIIGKTPAHMLGARVATSSRRGDPYYVFVLVPVSGTLSREDYREMRRNLLHSYCMVVKLIFPDAEDIIGFATEAGRGEHGSEDLIYLDARYWTEEDQAQAEEFHNEVGLLKNLNRFATQEFEFPIEQAKKHKTRRRSKKK